MVFLTISKSYNTDKTPTKGEPQMNAEPLSGNWLLMKTLLDLSSLAKTDNTSAAGINNTAFQSMLEQILLEAETKTEQSSGRPSLLDELSLLNLSSTGLNSTSLLELAAAFGLTIPFQEQGSFAEINTDLGTNHSKLNGLEYKELNSSVLNSQLKGALSGTGELFIEAGKQYGINPSFLAAVAIHETGNGTSNAARFKNNVAGMMGKGGLKTYSSVRDSIFDMARNLRNNYLDEGKTTIAQIGAKYAPIGANNDPLQLNNHWVTGVQSHFETISKKTGLS